MVKKYRSLPRPTISYAAQYQPGEPLDDLREVARMLDPQATVSEVDDEGIAVIHADPWEQGGPSPNREYLVVPTGHFLVFSPQHYLLYESDPERFAESYEAQ